MVPPVRPDSRVGSPSQTTEFILRASSLAVSYGMTSALDDVSLDVRAGRSVAIVGPSGSGKSTLLHCLAGLVLPDAGSVFLGEAEVTALGDRERSALRLSRMGIVFQFGELLPELTVAENVALPLWVTGTRRGAATVRAAEVLQSLEIGHLADRHPGEVSGGERQRAAVARALVHAPAIVFADEPTGALDSRNADRVMSVLIDQAQRHESALVLVTHENRFANLCETTVEMVDGRLAQPVPC